MYIIKYVPWLCAPAYHRHHIPAWLIICYLPVSTVPLRSVHVQVSRRPLNSDSCFKELHDFSLLCLHLVKLARLVIKHQTINAIDSRESMMNYSTTQRQEGWIYKHSKTGKLFNKLKSNSSVCLINRSPLIKDCFQRSNDIFRKNLKYVQT